MIVLLEYHQSKLQSLTSKQRIEQLNMKIWQTS